jgi:hypothetical protein
VPSSFGRYAGIEPKSVPCGPVATRSLASRNFRRVTDALAHDPGDGDD